MNKQKAAAQGPNEEKADRQYDQSLRTMSTSELIQELGTLKWHYALFRDSKKFDMICAVELEIARRRGSLKPTLSNDADR